MAKQNGCLTQLLFFVITIAVVYISSPLSSPFQEQVQTLYRRDPIAGGIELRILPLGDSITHGYQSTDFNGYRSELYDKLSATKLVFVGSLRDGSVANNHHEGHGGATISQIATFAKKSLSSRPNVVLLHAGTNDLLADPPKEPYDGAAVRLGGLLDQITSACPDATILVAKIIHSDDNSDGLSRIASYNAQIPGLVSSRVAAGHADIAVVDFTAIGAHAELADGIHPNDGTYKRMGDIWFTAIEDAASKGWIKAPFGPDPPRVSGSSGSKQECLAGLFLFQPDGGKLEASGVGHTGNHCFVSNWAPPLELSAGFGLNYIGIRLAYLDGDGKYPNNVVSSHITPPSPSVNWADAKEDHSILWQSTSLVCLNYE